MSVNDLRTCVVCKTKYEYCPTCSKYAGEPTWKAIFCSEACRTFKRTIEAYMMGKLTAVEAKAKLDSLNIDRTNVPVQYQATILDIESDVKKKIEKEIELKRIADAKVKAEEEAKIKEKLESAIKKPKRRRKKKTQ